MTDDTTTDTTEQLEHRPTITPEAWAAVFALVELAADPKGFKRRLHGLANALSAVDAAQRKLAADRTEHDAVIAKDRTELEQERTAQFNRLYRVQRAEAGLQEREARCHARETELGLHASHPDFVPIAGTTITREPERRTVRTDNSGTDFPQSTTIARTEQSEAPVASRVRPSRSARVAP